MKVNILAVAVFPGTATRLFISDSWSNALGSAPVFNCALYSVSVDDADPENPVETETTLKSGMMVEMTRVQWDAWPPGADDEAYITTAILTNLGLTKA